MEEKKRFEYIDLMKGICIIMVVLQHCSFFNEGLSDINVYLRPLRMPLYFFLSGLFFKTYGNFKNFTLKKTNNLIIPYIFFVIIAIIPHCMIFSQTHDVYSFKYIINGFLLPFYNFPLWFLKSLFLINIIYYVLCRLIPNINFRIFSTFIISIVIWFIVPYIKENGSYAIRGIFLYMNLSTALFMLPFFSLAEYLKNNISLLTLKLKPINSFLYFCITASILIISITDNIDLQVSNYGDNLILFYISSFAGVFSVYFLSKLLNRVFYISYMGRYSIIVLGTHMIIIYMIGYIFPNIHIWQKAIITLALCPLFIYVFKKYFPYFTAQKNILCQ